MLNMDGLLHGTSRNWTSLHIKWALVMFGVVFVETINYVATTPRIVNNPEWAVNITTKCPKANMAKAYATQSMIDAGIVGVGFGSYLGILFHSRIHPGLLLKETSSERHWYKWPLLRVLLAIVICSPLYALTRLKPQHISNVYMLALLKTFVPTLVSGFICFGVLDWVCIKLNILTFVKKEDAEDEPVKEE